jgi:outer membrane protein, multidrug efflux system
MFHAVNLIRLMKTQGSVLVFILPLFLTGCHSMAPSHQLPAMPVAQSFPTTDNIETGANAASLGWQDYFADPQLLALLNSALDYNRDLRQAVLRVENARALYGIQRADLFPGLNAQGSYGRSRTPADMNLTGRPLLLNDYQVNLGVTNWELDFWGRVRNLKDAALESFLASDASRQAFTISLISEVANTYLTLRELDERLLIAKKTIATRSESFRIFKRRFEVGAISKLELNQIEILLAQAQTLEYQLQQLRATQLNALTLLVGNEITLSTTEDDFEDAHILRAIKVGLPSDMLIARPDIVAAEHMLKAANANIGAARAAFFPRITLTAAFGTASRELDNLFDSGSHAWQFAPSLTLPIFDGGRNRANLKLAEVRRDMAVATYEKTIQSAFREVADALAARQWVTKQIGTQQQTVNVQAERARLAELRYNNGATSYFEVLDAQRTLLDEQQQLVQMRRALLSSQVSLYAALGGGSQSIATVAPTAQPSH